MKIAKARYQVGVTILFFKQLPPLGPTLQPLWSHLAVQRLSPPVVTPINQYGQMKHHVSTILHKHVSGV